MRTLQLIGFWTAALSVVLFSASCSKSTAPAAAKVQELGEIALVTQTPKRVPLSEGKELVVTPAAMPWGEVQLSLEMQPKPTNSSMHPFEQGAVLIRFVRSGKEYELPVGDGFIRFTPRFKEP